LEKALKRGSPRKKEKGQMKIIDDRGRGQTLKGKKDLGV